MSYKVIFGIVFGALSIGSAYALTTAHSFVDAQPDLSLTAIGPALPRTVVESVAIRPTQQEPVVAQSPAPVVASLSPNAEPVTKSDTANFSAVEASPRPLARILVPQQTTGSGSAMVRPVQKSLNAPRINELWVIGAFR